MRCAARVLLMSSLLMASPLLAADGEPTLAVNPLRGGETIDLADYQDEEGFLAPGDPPGDPAPPGNRVEADPQEPWPARAPAAEYLNDMQQRRERAYQEDQLRIEPPAPGGMFEPGHESAFAGSDWASYFQLPIPATHTDPNDPYRYRGRGEPIIGSSWRNRPVFTGFFIGARLSGDDILSGRVKHSNGSFLGLRLGWDFDHYWGGELRYAYSSPELTDNSGNSLGDSHDYFVDASLAFYPWGDTRWRPFIGAGVGVTTYRFRDELDRRIHDSAFTLPISLGIKYYASPIFSLRVDVTDHISFGSDNLSAMQNFSLTIGGEMRFGGRNVSYMPWHGNSQVW